MVAARVRQHVLHRSAQVPRLRLGVCQPLHVRARVRVSRYVPGVLPARQDRHGTKTTSPDRSSSAHSRNPAVLVAASLIGGNLSDRTGRRKIFILIAATVYGLALFAIAAADNFNGFLVGMAISGLGFGMYMAVDLALVADVLPDKVNAAKDLGVLNMAGALPFSIAPAIAPVILSIGNGNYGTLYAVAGVCAIVGAVSILPVKRVR